MLDGGGTALTGGGNYCMKQAPSLVVQIEEVFLGATIGERFRLVPAPDVRKPRIHHQVEVFGDQS
jgi:hypothetical protein